MLPGRCTSSAPSLWRNKKSLDFGKRFVPLSYHTDLELAKKSIYGGLIASGWHTAALMMRLYTDHYLSKVANLGSPGADELKWDRPVFPGDDLSIRVTVLETRRSESKPDRGIIRSFVEVLNQNREVVMSVKMVNFVRSRGSVGRVIPEKQQETRISMLRPPLHSRIRHAAYNSQSA